MNILSLLLLVTTLHSADVVVNPTKAEEMCLARNIFYESRGEPLIGKLAVAKVTLNRTKDPEYHDSICGVVFQKGQFSWTAEHVKAPRDWKEWQLAQEIAHYAVTTGMTEWDSFTATYYHTLAVKPGWRKHKIVACTIGNHIFYNEKRSNERLAAN